MITLIKKNWNNVIHIWSISDTGIIEFGQLGGAIQRKTVNKKEINSRIRTKRMQGYIDVIELGLGNTSLTLNNPILLSKIDRYNWITNDTSILPLKCITYKRNYYSYYPAYCQPKLNGIRCIARVETITEGIGMFAVKKKRVVLRSKKGLEYVMPHITETLHMLPDNIVLDGELYCHGLSLNQIDSSVPSVNKFGTVSVPTLDPMKISFYVFDLAIPDMSQKERLELLRELSKVELSNSTFVKVINEVTVNNDDEVEQWRDYYISKGFEGCVVRAIEPEYQFGSRPNFMMKAKVKKDKEFLIVDIVPASNDDYNVGCKFICKNDINDETFEVMPKGLNKHEQLEHLTNKELYIGKNATLVFFERSGVKQVPFHANLIAIRDYE